jgi:hypothetical protein
MLISTASSLAFDKGQSSLGTLDQPRCENQGTNKHRQRRGDDGEEEGQGMPQPSADACRAIVAAEAGAHTQVMATAAIAPASPLKA